LIVLTDADNNVAEGNTEINNSRVFPVTVSRALLPDLIVENIEAPATAFFDQTITVRWTVKNSGNASTNRFQSGLTSYSCRATGHRAGTTLFNWSSQTSAT
jgi:subtilase family serine protease